MKLAQARQLAQQLLGNWPEHTVSEQTITNYIDFLRELDEQSGRMVVRRALRTLQFLPKIKELEAIAREVGAGEARRQAKENLRAELERTWAEYRSVLPDYRDMDLLRFVRSHAAGIREIVADGGPKYFADRLARLGDIEQDILAELAAHPVSSDEARDAAEVPV